LPLSNLLLSLSHRQMLKTSLLLFLSLSFQVWAMPAGQTPLFPKMDKDTVFEKGSPVPSPEVLSKCVDAAAKKLGIDVNMKTDIKLLNDILENDMHMKDMAGTQSLLKTELVAEQPLLPMLEKVRKGLTAVHPAVGVALCVALSDEKTAGIFDAPNAAYIKRTIHHMFLLDKIVDKMARDRVYMKDVNSHLIDKVHSMTPHKSWIGHIYDLFKAAGMFGVAKSYSINGAMDDYAKFREAGVITHDESESRKQGLTLNCLEATVADFAHGYFENAKVGRALSWDHPSVIDIVGQDRQVEYVNRMEYAQLYETWNLAFITGNLDYLNMLYPKLLIPTVILADANSYLFKRVLALAVSINFYLMATLQGKERVNFKGSKDLSDVWGHVNARYVDFQPPKPTA